VIGGWIPDGREPFRELLLGEYINGELRYVGQVGAGFSSRVTRAIARMFSPCAVPPFADQIFHLEAKFCAPTLRISVEFLDLTDEGYLPIRELQALRGRSWSGQIRARFPVTCDLECSRNWSTSRKHRLDSQIGDLASMISRFAVVCTRATPDHAGTREVLKYSG
jgi:hypothetical protein